MYVCVCVCVCVCACVRACVHACVRACVRSSVGLRSVCQSLYFIPTNLYILSLFILFLCLSLACLVEIILDEICQLIHT